MHACLVGTVPYGTNDTACVANRAKMKIWAREGRFFSPLARLFLNCFFLLAETNIKWQVTKNDSTLAGYDMDIILLRLKYN